MSLFPSSKSKEFWGLMAAAFVFYVLSTIIETEHLKNVLVVVSGILFVVALLRLRGSS